VPGARADSPTWRAPMGRVTMWRWRGQKGGRAPPRSAEPAGLWPFRRRRRRRRRRHRMSARRLPGLLRLFLHRNRVAEEEEEYRSGLKRPGRAQRRPGVQRVRRLGLAWTGQRSPSPGLGLFYLILIDLLGELQLSGLRLSSGMTIESWIRPRRCIRVSCQFGEVFCISILKFIHDALSL